MEQANNVDVGKCINAECEIYSQCYRSIAQSSTYDFQKICNEENLYKWFILNKTNNESEK